MEDPAKRSLELEKEVESLQNEFEMGLREKENLMDALGLTPEKLNAFDGKLTPGDRKILAEKRKEIEAEIEAAGRVQEQPGKKTKFRPTRGLKV